MAPHRLVILEDHSLIRELLCRALSTKPELEVAANGCSIKEGIRQCLELRPDLIISGWNLADGTGLELIRALRTLQTQPRVLIVCGDELDGIVRDAAESGIHGFVSMRQSFEILQEAIHSVLRGKCYYCPSSSRMLLEAMREKSPAPQPALSNREREVLKALASGRSTKDMAQEFRLSPKTISNQITILKDKLGIQEPAGLVLYAHRHGLIRLQ